MGIMKNQIKLSPYDPTKKLKLIMNGAKTVGTGFLMLDPACFRKIDTTAHWKLRLKQHVTIGYINLMKLSYSVIMRTYWE